MSLRSDLRSAFRSLSATRGTTLLAVATLAVGLGASTAMFSAIQGILLRPLPYAEPGGIVRVTPRTAPGADQISWPNFEDLRSWTTSLEKVAGFSTSGMFVYGGEEPEQVRGVDATHDLFAVLGVQPLLGRPFTAEEDRAGGPAVMLISWEWWQRRFGGDESVIGRTVPVTVDGSRTRTIIGVMPRGFQFPIGPEPVDFYDPLEPWISEDDRTGRDSVWMDVVARLAPGRSASEADAELAAISTRLEQLDLAANRDLRLRAIPLRDEILGGTDRALWVLFAAVVVVLLIGCVNVANLLLGRAATRVREMAVRSALGASRARIVRQLLLESGMIGLAAGLAGLAIASAGIRLLLAIAPADIPRLDGVAIDWRVFLFGIGMAALTGIAFGLVPALTAASGNPGRSLSEGSRGTTEGRGRGRLREGLVVAEIALALLLLPAAGVLLRSFWNLGRVDVGFEPRNVMMLDLSLRSSKHESDEQVLEAAQQLRSALGSLPGVESVASARMLPFFQSNWVVDVTIEGKPEPEPGRGPVPAYVIVSPGYFSTMRIPLLRGRALSERDAAGAPLAAVVSESFARTWFTPGEDPVGRRLRLEAGLAEIVGVVADVREADVMREPMPALYVPLAQAVNRRVRMLVRTSPGSGLTEAALRGVVRELDPLQPIIEIRPLDEMRSEAFAARRLALALLLSLATLAFLLAAVGIYGVMSNSVTRRRAEIGVRMAFGARPSDILRLVLRRVFVMAALGGAIGLLGAAAGTRLIGRFLYGVTAADPLTFAAILVLLSLVALAAAWVPARRAARVDPIRAIRYE